MDPKQFYSGYHIDLNDRTIEVLTDNYGVTSLMDEWRLQFADFNKVNLCLSGGIDSQFALSILTKLQKDVKVYIFSFIWDDTVFNSPDVLHAIRYCERFGHSYINIDVDFKKFVQTNQHLNYCLKYKTFSPQIALHLKMLDLIENNNPIFFGTEIPIVHYSVTRQRAEYAGILNHRFATNAFLNYSLENDKIVIKDLFSLNPRTHYLGFKQYIETSKNNKLFFPADASNTSNAAQPLKRLLYTDIGADLIPPLLKNTGFELLKMHLAKSTGVYNQFDIDYRYPLENALRRETWYSQNNFKVKFKNSVMESMRIEYEEFCKTTDDIQPIDIYNFIL